MIVGGIAIPEQHAQAGAEHQRQKTLRFMWWLGIAFPRWLENELCHALDPLETSLRLRERIFADAWEYARDKSIPLEVDVETVSRSLIDTT